MIQDPCPNPWPLCQYLFQGQDYLVCKITSYVKLPRLSVYIYSIILRYTQNLSLPDLSLSLPVNPTSPLPDSSTVNTSSDFLDSFDTFINPLLVCLPYRSRFETLPLNEAHRLLTVPPVTPTSSPSDSRLSLRPRCSVLGTYSNIPETRNNILTTLLWPSSVVLLWIRLKTNFSSETYVFCV